MKACSSKDVAKVITDASNYCFLVYFIWGEGGKMSAEIVILLRGMVGKGGSGWGGARCHREELMSSTINRQQKIVLRLSASAGVW